MLLRMLTVASQVIDIDSDKNWYKAEQDGRTGFVPSNYLELSPHPYATSRHMSWHALICTLSSWFHGKIKRFDAEQILLKSAVDGAYLFRESETAPGKSGCIDMLGTTVSNRLYCRHLLPFSAVCRY
jgi:uncharacterized NAD(P)/FAD-binding protein YdhS